MKDKRGRPRKQPETALVKQEVAPPRVTVPEGTMSKLIVRGDLSGLSEPERVQYYLTFCKHLGLDPVTRPFDLLNLNGKLVLYAHKGCTDQLRKKYGVSVTDVRGETVGDCYRVTALGRDHTGRTDASTGVVRIKKLEGDALANALMKAETKAKRRLTLSLCGLGMLDETEIETIPGATVVDMAVDIDSPGNGKPKAPVYDVGTWTPEVEDQPAEPVQSSAAPSTPTGKPAHTLGNRLTTLIMSPLLTEAEREEIRRDYRGKCKTEKQRGDFLNGWEAKVEARGKAPALTPAEEAGADAAFRNPVPRLVPAAHGLRDGP